MMEIRKKSVFIFMDQNVLYVIEGTSRAAFYGQIPEIDVLPVTGG